MLPKWNKRLVAEIKFSFRDPIWYAYSEWTCFQIHIAMRTLQMGTIKMFCQIRLFGETLITDLTLINTVFGKHICFKRKRCITQITWIRIVIDWSFIYFFALHLVLFGWLWRTSRSRHLIVLVLYWFIIWVVSKNNSPMVSATRDLFIICAIVKVIWNRKSIGWKKLYNGTKG